MRNAGVLSMVLAVTTACSANQQTTLTPTRGAPMRITFSPAQDIVASNPRGESMVFATVSELRGTMISARQDSLFVGVQSLQGPSGPIRVPVGTVAHLQRTSSVNVEASVASAPGGSSIWNVMAVVVIVGGGLLLLLSASKPLGGT